MSDEKAALKLLEDVQKSSLLKPLADSTTHVVDTFPKRHHPSLGSAHQAKCAYTNLFSALYADHSRQNLTAKTKAQLIKTKNPC